MRPVLLACLILGVIWPAPTPAQDHNVGIAGVDITPKFPVRLNGFGFRRTESEGVTQRIWAKALAIDTGDDPAVLIAVDNLGIPRRILDDVSARLEKKLALKPGRLAITATHTHTAPMLAGQNVTLFGEPIPPDHIKHIDQYTIEFIDKLEAVAWAALKDRKPARLSWGIGKVGFAANRRTRGGPVDHDLPTLVVRDFSGKIRAIYVSYACHCVTLSNNKVSGDWAGYAQQSIQDAFPGVTALVSVGCGADSNPSSGVTGDKTEIASRQGMEIAREVKRLTEGFLAPVTGKLTIQSKDLALPLAALPDRIEWEARAKKPGAVGHHAKVQLAKLDRGEKLTTKIDYSVRTWSFGNSLAMVFLPGEVVVDYSLRLKRELDASRLWINAYSNDAPCYIPSERVLKEGGYEGGGAMIYYDVPGPFQPGLEQPIIDAVRQQLGKSFAATIDPTRTGESLPPSAQQAAALIQTKPDLTVEVMAAEPLVASPVAIDFGPDHKLWVAEMYDYPSGLDGKFGPGGRVRVLDYRDGRFVSSMVFLDGIPFPTGILVWRKGVLVCAAPDILYAEDTDGDGKADVIKKLYSGFGTGNYQGRVNSLQYGLDGWVYGSCGLFGGQIKSFASEKPLDLGDRDFRIKPDTGEIEPATGRTQQGRVRDDWGNWFGCTNSQMCLHYPLADHYLRRNPHVAPPPAAVVVNDQPNANQLFPVGTQQLFKLSGPAGRTTAACGIGIYRDELLGKQYTGNAFTCEPANMLVHRLVLSPKGCTFTGRRADDEQNREFLASPDAWFRPVQAVTGPDGCLWIVDMCRYVIEHPRWIPPEEAAKVDLRAGYDRGRIYRIRPKNREPRPWANLAKLDTRGLVDALDSPNGWQRDMAMQLLVWRGEKGTARMLVNQALVGEKAPGRLQALAALQSLNLLRDSWRESFAADENPGVRCFAIEHGPARDNALNVQDAQTRLATLLQAGNLPHRRASSVVAFHLNAFFEDPHLLSAAFSCLNERNVAEVIGHLRTTYSWRKIDDQVLQGLLSTANKVLTLNEFLDAIKPMFTYRIGAVDSVQVFTAGVVLDTLERNKVSLRDLSTSAIAATIKQLYAECSATVVDSKATESDRVMAMVLLGRDPAWRVRDIGVLSNLLTPQQSPALQSAALTTLGRIGTAQVAEKLTAGWAGYTPALQTQVLDLLLSRPAWQTHLVNALETRAIPAGQIDAARRQRLMAVKDDAARKRVEKLLTAVSADRQKVIESYRETMNLKGSGEKGKEVFTKRCAVCHKLGDAGHAVGPDLTGLANKSPQYLLQEILDPNRNLDSRYVGYLAETKNGRSYTGLLASESATSITLRGQENQQHVLLRTDIESLTSTGKSLMPEGLEKDLTKQDFADLFAYLDLSFRAQPPKRQPGNSPQVVRAINGRFALLATACEIHGGDIAFEPDFKNIGYWHGLHDHVMWTIEIAKAGEFDVYLDWSCDNRSANNPYVLEAGAGSIRGKTAGTGGWDKYQQAKIGTIALSAGQIRLILRPDGVKPTGALMDLRGVYLIPKGEKPNFTAEPAKTPVTVSEAARLILDDATPRARREELVKEFVGRAPELIVVMTVDIRDSKEEYRRIPWIWRVAIAAGRKNDGPILKLLLAVSLPARGKSLRDWQAVVIGGGIINGLSLEGLWPGKRIDELLAGDKRLREIWQAALADAQRMADDDKVPHGTRYDALRMIALDAGDASHKRLAKYLAKGTHAELQMGAISGLSDIDSPEAAALLAAGLGHYPAGNRKLAIDGLLRTEERTRVLIDRLEKGEADKGWLDEAQRKKFMSQADERLRERARKLLSK